MNFTKDPGETVQSATKNAVMTTVEKVSVQLGMESRETTSPRSSGIVPRDAEQTEARNALLRKMFFQKGDSFFTQSRWGANPVPYELREFELVGPKQLPTTGADGNNGIDQRVSYSIRVRAYRVYDPAAGWGSWNPENPPQLDSITMVRQDGKWKVVSDPSRLYALK